VRWWLHFGKNLLFFGLHTLGVDHSPCQLGSERFCNLLRFTDTRAFNDNMIKPFFTPSETCKLCKEVTTQGATNASILHLDDLFLYSDFFSVTFSSTRGVGTADEVCVNVYGCHVIHYDSDSEAMVWRLEYVA
jgi:hypothetical protein